MGKDSKRLAFKLKDPKDFNQWKYILENKWALDEKKESLLKGEVIPEDSEAWTTLAWKSKEVYKRKELEMKVEVIESLSSSYSRLVMDKKRFIDLWTELEKQVVGETRVRVARINAKLRSMEWRGSMKKLCTHFKEVSTEYLLLKGSLSESDLVEELLAVIPHEYNYVEHSLRTNARRNGITNLKMDEVIEELLTAEANAKGKKKIFRRDQKPSHFKKRFPNRKDRRKGEIAQSAHENHEPCEHCGKSNHKSEDCWKKFGRPKKNQFWKKRNFRKRNDFKNEENDSSSESSDSEAETANVALISTEKENEEFVLDSGASKHFCSNLRLMFDLKKTKPIVIDVAKKGVTVESEKVGKIELIGKNNCRIVVKDVFYVPEGRNLLSVSSFLNEGFKVKFQKKIAYIKEKDGNVMRAVSDGKIWKMKAANKNECSLSSEVKKISLNLWHHRFRTPK